MTSKTKSSKENDTDAPNNILQIRLDKCIEEINSANAEISSLKNTCSIKSKKLSEAYKRIDSLEAERYFFKEAAENFKSNTTAFPYMAGIVSDIICYNIGSLTPLEYKKTHTIKIQDKISKIIEIRQEAKKLIEQYKESEYQLNYLLELYPQLQEVIECEFNDLPKISSLEDLPDRDPVREFLSDEEYKALSESERNQYALDRYLNSHNKTKWQIGRDYELYIGYLYSKNAIYVNTYGSNMGLEDLGRDLIVETKNNLTLIIQCKYWSQNKEIHEKHIMQLYGTVVGYCIENSISQDSVKGILITNTKLSAKAKKFAKNLHISYKENLPMGEYPRIKCNINRNEYGEITKIYHLPFDQQYDNVKINAKGEFYAFTVKEAEDAGFRRAYKWNNKE